MWWIDNLIGWIYKSNFTVKIIIQSGDVFCENSTEVKLLKVNNNNQCDITGYTLKPLYRWRISASTGSMALALKQRKVVREVNWEVELIS